MSFSQHLRQLGRPIAYYPQLAKCLGGVTATVLFCQLFYWQDKTDHPLGVYKTLDELMEETGLTERELRSAREKLRELGVVVETNKRLEHRLYFKVDYDALDRLMATSFREEPKRHSANSQNVTPPNDKTSFREQSKRHSVNTETTTENTFRQESINARAKKSKNPTALSDFEVCFSQFWQAGLPKVNKSKALKNFKSSFEKVCSQQPMSLEAFTAMLVNDVKTRLGLRQFGFDRLHPATYLNNQRWLDEQSPPDEPSAVFPAGNLTGSRFPDDGSWSIGRVLNVDPDLIPEVLR